MIAFLNKANKKGAGLPETNGTASKTKEKRKALVPWVEKYRPRTVDDVVEQDEVVAVLKESLEGSDLPNLLLYGPPGTGKTSTILAASRQLFGDQFKDRILELNASDERGIDVIRGKVKNFSQLSASGTRTDGKPCPPFKIVILDEADSMTHAAQAALRRTMEKECQTTRFCLVCNYVSRIIEPITSRCTKFRFKPLGEQQIMDRLTLIAKEEKLDIEESALMAINTCSGGDLRRAITVLQSSARLNPNGAVTDTQINEISGIIPEEILEQFLTVCAQGDYNVIVEFVNSVFYEGFSVGILLEQLNDVIIFKPTLTNQQKSSLCAKIAECLARLQEGASEYLQLMDLCCVAIKTLQAE